MLDLVKTRKRVDSLLSDLRTARRVCAEEREKLTEAEDRRTYIEEAQWGAQLVAKEVQQRAHKRIAGVVDTGLKTVFVGEDVYGFRIRFDRKRGKTDAVLILIKNGHEVADPLNEDSGGVVDVAAFILRTSCIVLAKPNLRRFLALDEPFKFVSKEYRNNVRLLLEGLSKDFRFQYLMVTHEPAYHIGKVIEL